MVWKWGLPWFHATLKLSQHERRLKARGGGPWRRLDLAVKQDQRLVDGGHLKSVYVNIDIYATATRQRSMLRRSAIRKFSHFRRYLSPRKKSLFLTTWCLVALIL